MENRAGNRARAGSTAKPAKNLVSEVLSIVVFALSLFTFLALLTYNPADPSVFSTAKALPQNACGKVGASLSALALQCFGLGAFLLPAALFFIAARIHRREGIVRFLGTLGGMTVAVMSLTVFLTLQWKYWPFAGSLLLTGGAFGAWVADFLIRGFNSVGSSIVSLVVFALAIVLSTPVSVARFGAQAISVASGYLWRLTRVAGTYLIYLFGLVAMRAAHAAGDLLQKLIESAISRTRERAAAARQAAAERKAEKALAPPVAVGKALEDRSGFDGAADSAGAEEHENEHPAAPALASLLTSEAPDILPALMSDSALEADSEGDEDEEEQDAIDMAQLKAKAAGKNGKSNGPAIIAPDVAAANAYDRLKASPRTTRRAGNWKLPTVEFLRKPPKVESTIERDRERLMANSKILAQKFADFGIDGEVTAVRPGPVITLYEFKPGPGVKVSRIASLADDLSMALSAQSVRILAPLPGKAVVGIEIPSESRETVYLREFLQHPDFYGAKHSIPVVMGKDIGGQSTLSDLARMPHLLCAGQTGSGKSVFMNGLICSLLYRFTPDELRMILVDPKFIEFRSYQDIPHLLLPVVDDPKQAAIALRWAVREMERRYRILAKLNARNLASYNAKVEEMGADVVRDLLFSEENQGEFSPQAPSQVSGGDWIEAFEPGDDGAPKVGKLPYIVVIIDELADLMMIAKKEVEISIARIAQKARAAGIHLVIATQRPSTDVITGLIKANLPSRVSFQLASFVDSKTILDRAGAERLLGQGDMLFIPPGVSNSVRLHGAFVDDDEINKITAFLRSQGKPSYRDEILISDENDEDGDGGDGDDDSDDLFEQAVDMVKRSGHASASGLQRHFRIGYNRAARLIETMEARGIVGPADGARPREVLMR
jgi:S-DNA-T family DNA segregation ATPase FtsK/SpoIIIE